MIRVERRYFIDAWSLTWSRLVNELVLSEYDSGLPLTWKLELLSNRKRFCYLSWRPASCGKVRKAHFRSFCVLLRACQLGPRVLVWHDTHLDSGVKAEENENPSGKKSKDAIECWKLKYPSQKYSNEPDGWTSWQRKTRESESEGRDAEPKWKSSMPTQTPTRIQ